MRFKDYWIFLDMDGVIIAFDEYISSRYGKSFRQMSKEEKTRLWLTDFKAEWFKEMGLRHDALDLVNYTRQNFVHKRILTALPNRRHDLALASMYAKIESIHETIGHDIPVTFGPLAIDKQNHCGGKKFILVDDNEQNILQWSRKGGIAVFHTDTKSTIEKIEEGIMELEKREKEECDHNFVVDKSYRDSANSKVREVCSKCKKARYVRIREVTHTFGGLGR